MPLAGLVLARRGREDLLVPPRLTPRPAPIAFLIGPPAFGAMKVDVDDMIARFGAIRVGREQLATTTGLPLQQLRAT